MEMKWLSASLQACLVRLQQGLRLTGSASPAQQTGRALSCCLRTWSTASMLRQVRAAGWALSPHANMRRLILSCAAARIVCCLQLRNRGLHLKACRQASCLHACAGALPPALGPRRQDIIVVASLLDKAPNLAGLSRTCEVGESCGTAARHMPVLQSLRYIGGFSGAFNEALL